MPSFKRNLEYSNFYDANKQLINILHSSIDIINRDSAQQNNFIQILVSSKDHIKPPRLAKSFGEWSINSSIPKIMGNFGQYIGKCLIGGTKVNNIILIKNTANDPNATDYNFDNYISLDMSCSMSDSVNKFCQMYKLKSHDISKDIKVYLDPYFSEKCN